ncbi:hypothetical protein PAXRUDRAFT_16378 [Paxillus rubicundulus Ve08.2h10]|uniref:Uncharacterized protein n=1 Tax=Paxillus rubicundulus Ve08.2h10 TaxID=930991 RepID=A0A0D0DEJ1_9AGAM|nr:hypothetical protein PAXRUDRAFT_16378 [Paxillus rubicundulus Ve08.2h10]
MCWVLELGKKPLGRPVRFMSQPHHFTKSLFCGHWPFMMQALKKFQDLNGILQVFPSSELE